MNKLEKFQAQVVITAITFYVIFNCLATSLFGFHGSTQSEEKRE